MRIFVDGSCLKNPGGIGAWASVFVSPDDEVIHKASNFIPVCTNQQAEILALQNGVRLYLELFSSAKRLSVFSDSSYVVNIVNGIYKVKANKEYWDSTLELIKSLTIPFSCDWVRGHSTNTFNNIADELARKTAQEYRLLMEKESND
jgi:ribonuclease HI